MAYKMSPNAKLVVALVIIFAIIIPLLVAYALIFPLGLSLNHTTVASASSSSLSTSVGTSSGASGQTQVIIPSGIGSNTKLNFEPPSVTVAPGTTVVWMNQDTSTHNIYFTTMPGGASISPNPSPNTPQWTNNEYSVTLTVPGTYTYVCQYHSWMTGTIIVS